MKKRFTLMMMVLCFLMSIPLKMMAFDEVKVVSQYKQGKDWKENPNFNFTTEDGEIYTCTFRVRVLLLRRIEFIIYGAVELFCF